MAGIEESFHEIRKLNTLQQRDQWMNHLHPLVKFALCVFYILIVISIDKYALSLMCVMAVYPFVSYQLADLSVKQALGRMKAVLPLVLAVGIFNPFFDRQPMMQIGSLILTGGMISMLTLMLKGIYTVLSAYLLIATTSIESLCHALRMLHVPKLMVTTILLINRYIYILGEEAERIMNAYKLRAPRQKGIHYKGWGSLVGQWLIRSMDRAQMVYESMLLRGFSGEYSLPTEQKPTSRGMLYLLFWMSVLLILRVTPIIELVGHLFVK